MPSSSANHQRRSIRLKNYDYSQPGSYFVTICTHGQKNMFGSIIPVRAGSEPARTEPARTEPARTESSRTEPARTESARTEPARTEPASTETARTFLDLAEPAHAEPAHTKPTRKSKLLIQNFEINTSEDFAIDLNTYGKIVLYTWNDLVNHNKNIKLGDFVIMPNHVHGIIHILDLDNEWEDFIPSNFVFHDVRAGSEPARTVLDLAETTRTILDPAEPDRTILDPAEPALTDRLATKQQEPTNVPQLKQTSLSEIIRQFKTFSARRINQIRKTSGIPVWKRDYFEHIIRNQESYDQIVQYIQNNPMMWKLDKLYVD